MLCPTRRTVTDGTDNNIIIGFLYLILRIEINFPGPVNIILARKNKKKVRKPESLILGT
jgi:hypothetical protein